MGHEIVDDKSSEEEEEKVKTGLIEYSLDDSKET